MFLQWIHKIEPSALCNRACQYCVNRQLGYQKGNMTMETFERILHWTKLLNPTGQPSNEPFLHFRGIGEPLLNSNIIEMVGKMSELRPVCLSTNGDFLTEELLRELIQARIGLISVSKHDAEVAERCKELLRRYNVPYHIQDQFNDDWAGQINWERTSFPCSCAHIETGGAMVIWDGRIITCCVDGQGRPVLGNVYEDDIRHIDIAPIPLCVNCRSNFFWKWKLLRKYSSTLSQREKERFFKQWLLTKR